MKPIDPNNPGKEERTQYPKGTASDHNYYFNPYEPRTATGEVYPWPKEKRRHFEDVTIPEIMEKLKVSRDFVSKKIIPALKHTEHLSMHARGGPMYDYDGALFRRWLMTNAKFTRQTRRIHVSKMLGDLRIADREILLGKIPSPFADGRRKNPVQTLPPHLSERHRQDIPPVEVAPFDFWDKKLYFPKEYYRTDHPEPGEKPLTAEMCYRDMFLAGAIKIQLGKQKTMFYVPEMDELPPASVLRDIPIDDISLPLVPAAWVPKKGYVPEDGVDTGILAEDKSEGAVKERKMWWMMADDRKPRYRVSFEILPRALLYPDMVNDRFLEIETALRKGFLIDWKQLVRDPKNPHAFLAEFQVHNPPTDEEVQKVAARMLKEKEWRK